MKTRNDFVSNSSSCSFVVVMPGGTKFDDFVKQVAKECIRYAEPNEIEFSKKQDELNKAVLNYHLRASELLFLGSLKVDDVTRRIDKKDDPAEFDRVKLMIASGHFRGEGSEVVSEDENSIVLKFADMAGEIAVRSNEMPYITGNYRWCNGYSTDLDKQKESAEKIVKFAKVYSDHSPVDYKARYNSGTYFISRDTIWNTRALIAAGKDVSLDAWMDLDRLESALDDGAKIFRVHVNNGGDGVSEDALYTFGGWEGENLFNNVTGIDVVYSETM